MTIEQKAWNIAHETSPGIKDTASQHSDREDAARLGIIEGRKEALEQAAKMMEELAVAFRELIEGQKI